MAGLAIITEACVDTKDRACVDVCPVQCIYEFNPSTNLLFSEDEAGSGEIATVDQGRGARLVNRVANSRGAVGNAHSQRI